MFSIHPLSYAQPQWVMTDARHDSTSNAYHTTVACISGRYSDICVVHTYTICVYNSTSKVVGICTVSREQHTIAQTRELECTKIVLPEVISRGIELNV